MSESLDEFTQHQSPADGAWDPFAAPVAPPVASTAPQPPAAPPSVHGHTPAPAGHPGYPQGAAQPPAGYSGDNLPARIVKDLEQRYSPESDEHRRKAAGEGWEFIDLDHEGLTLPADAVALLKAPIARQFRAVPVGVEGRKVIIAVPDPSDATTRDGLRPHLAGWTMRVVYANPRAIDRLIDTYYSARAEASELAMRKDENRADVSTDVDMGRIADSAGSSVASILNLTIEQALRDGASDIHFEPSKTQVIIRYRINGQMVVVNRHPVAYLKPLLQKIKVDSPGMKTDNFFVPDSGVYRHFGKGKGEREAVDIRVEMNPAAWGPTCVMRLQQNIWMPLLDLGFSAYNLERYQRALEQPYGINLATGPTGSGKSTTLYASVRELIHETKKIITLENPVEFKVPEMVTQMMINEAQGMDWKVGLRSILRSDPDIFLVGEIRDTATAEAAIDGAMTGHQVFSTLHTNTAPGVIKRLKKLGIDSDLLADSLLSAVGQRLVARLCEHCRVPRTMTKDEAAADGFNPDLLDGTAMLFEANPTGCIHCIAGITGRLPIHEVLLVTENLADAISEDAIPSEIRRVARDGGMTEMREDGWEKAIAGLTSVTAVKKTTRNAL